jgi:hypothetical protein
MVTLMSLPFRRWSLSSSSPLRRPLSGPWVLNKYKNYTLEQLNEVRKRLDAERAWMDEVEAFLRHAKRKK